MATGKQEFPLSLVIKAIDKATAPLRAVNEKIKAITAPVRKLNNSFKALSDEAGLPRVAAKMRGVGSAVQGVAQGLGAASTRMLGLAAASGGMAYGFQRLFIKPADEFERLSLSLEAIEGSAEKAKESLAFIDNLTVKTPFQMQELAQTFRVLRGFGMDPTNGSLQSITDQVAKLGGTGEDLTGVALQLGQAFSKGRLLAEDANILVERGVPVWGMLQRAVERVTHGRKVSVAQLRQMSEKGQLGQKAVKLLVEQMGLESNGASERMMGTWSGMISNISDQWSFFARRVMASGPLEAMKKRIGALLAKVDEMAKSGELQKLAESVGGTLVSAFNELSKAIPQVWNAVKDIGAAVKWAADMCGGWGNLLKFSLGAYIGGPLLVSVVTLTGALWSLGGAVLPMVARGGMLLWPVLSRLGASLLPMVVGQASATAAQIGALGGSLAAAASAAAPFLAAAAGVAAAGYAIWRNWDDLKTLFTDFTKPGGLLGTLKEMFGNLRELLPDKLWGTALHWWGRELGVTSQARPTLGAAAAVAASGAPSKQSEAHIQVDFANLPRGARVSTAQTSSANIDLSLGYSMVPP